ncbi:hypothetical protein [Streptomyces cinereoruber]|uniref:hypothetical protein n=1 Tax=Streptomyces cinereoruber TaxID=67260 RepID=UPI003C30098D
MSAARARTCSSSAEPTEGARHTVGSLNTRFLYDEDLAKDLDAILSTPVLPVRPWRHRKPSGFSWCGFFEPNRDVAAEVGRAVTRLGPMLDRLIAIAKKREWAPPYPNMAGAIARAVSVRAQQPCPTGDLVRDYTHLRLLAMVAAGLLGPLAEDDERN